MQAKALLFDLDDTLYNYAPCNRLALAAAREVLNNAVEVEPDKFHTLHDEVRNQLAIELEGQAASHNRIIFFKRIVEVVAGRSDSVLVHQMYERYWQVFYASMKPQIDAIEVLTRLSASHVLALVTNHTTLPQIGKINALGFDAFFDKVVTSEEAGVEKPAPRIFEIALECLRTDPSEAVMIGDSGDGDIEGAAALGIQTVQTTEFTGVTAGPAADYVITRLRQLLNLFSL